MQKHLKNKNNPQKDRKHSNKNGRRTKKNGIPHFYADIKIIPELFKKFKIEYLSQVQDIIQKKDGKIQTYWHYLLLIRKESDKN